MSVPADAKPIKKRTFRRIWLPCLVVCLAGASFAAIWLWPSEAFERPYRGISSVIVIQATILLLAIWLLFFSGLRWYLRVGILLAAGLAGYVAFLNVHFDGDVVPFFTFRPRSAHDALLESHRQSHSRAGKATAVEVVSDRPTDIPAYRGRNRDGVVIGPPLRRDLKTPPKSLWRQPIGGGYGSFAIAGNAAVTIEQRRDQEVVVCYDTATGREHWAHSYPAFFQETLGGDGPRATPTIDSGDVFSLGATGELCCLELRTGNLKWSTNILEGNANVRWGMSGSPLVYDQVVVINAGVQGSSAFAGSVVAYDRNSGKPRWSGGTTRAGYSSPMLATFAGKKQIVLLDGEQVGGYDASDGHPLWQYPWTAYSDINAAQPLVLDGDKVFVSTGYDKGCALLKISESGGKWSAHAVWGDPPSRALRAKFSSPVAHKGFIYGLDEGILACVDAETGKRKWKGGRYGHGQLLLADDLLVILSESGKLGLVEAAPDAEREIGSFQAIQGKTWNNFALVDGKAYVRNAEEMACYDLAKK
jgi:outer membrane protein assembly factor BamB